MVLKEWLERWLALDVGSTVKQRTLFSYSQMIRLHINPTLGDYDITSVRHENVQAMVNEMYATGNMRSGGGLSVNTVNLILIVLKTSLGYAVMQGLIEANPCDWVRKVKGNQKTIESFTPKEQVKIESAVRGSSDRRVFGITLAIYTGLRIGELLALTWEDVDYKESLIRVRKTTYTAKNADNRWVQVIDVPKTEQSTRLIPLSPELKRMLAKHRKGSTSQFIIDHKGELMAVRTYQCVFRALLKKNNIRKLGFHSLRHTFATRAIGLGVDVKTVSELLGHKNTMITVNRYVHSHMELKRKAISKLCKPLRANKVLENDEDLY